VSDSETGKKGGDEFYRYRSTRLSSRKDGSNHLTEKGARIWEKRGEQRLKKDRTKKYIVRERG